MFMTLLFWVVEGMVLLGSSVWIALLVYLQFQKHRLRNLADESEVPPSGKYPTLAVVIAARNEADTIEKGLRSLLAQDYPAITLIAVDDRSTDATGEILDRLNAEFPSLKVVHIKELPDGWLGKTWALQSGSEASTAEWTLFTDADVVFSQGALRKAVAAVERDGCDHLTIGPELPLESVGEKMFLSMFGLMMGIHAPVGQIEKRSSKAAIGVGAFNLVRSEVFRAIGGFDRIRLSVDDDMRLGQALKYGGYRTQILLGEGSVSVRWQVGTWGMIRGLEKNFFAGLDFRLGLVVMAVLFMLSAGLGPYVGLFIGPLWTRAIAASSVISLGLLLHQICSRYHIHWYYVFLMPFSALIMVYTLLRSTWITLRQGGVSWRDHLYPLSILRAHVRMRNAWLREVWLSTR